MLPRLVLIITLSCVSPSVVLATPILGSSSGVFSNPSGPGGGIFVGDGTNQFSWGAPRRQSGVNFQGGTFDTAIDQTFSLGTLVFTNAVLTRGTEARSVDLVATLLFTLPEPTEVEITIPFTLVNTPNTRANPRNPDFVLVPSGARSDVFWMNGVGFTFELLGFGAPTGEFAATFPQSGTFDPKGGSMLVTGEGRSITGELLGRVTAVVTPEPTTVLLLGSGLAAAALGSRWRRRRR